jgi:L-ascorbate metabolism protein UlaG (beta-lactamase superfamily)
VGGFEKHANKVQETVCKKLVLDMHYEAQNSVHHKLLCFKACKEDVKSRSKNL